MTSISPNPYEINDNYEKNIVNIVKIENYDAIKIESERLLKREKTILLINGIVTIGLFITLFNVL
jgi:hypothetical protein